MKKLTLFIFGFVLVSVDVFALSAQTTAGAIGPNGYQELGMYFCDKLLGSDGKKVEDTEFYIEQPYTMEIRMPTGNETSEINVENLVSTREEEYSKAKSKGGVSTFKEQILGHLDTLDTNIGLQNNGCQSVVCKKPDNPVSPALEVKHLNSGNDVRTALENVASLYEKATVLPEMYDQPFANWGPEEWKMKAGIRLTGDVTVPNRIAVAIFMMHAEEHFAAAVANNDPEEYRRGINLINLSNFQLEFRPLGYLYHVEKPKEPGLLEGLVPFWGSGRSFASDCAEGKYGWAFLDLATIYIPGGGGSASNALKNLGTQGVSKANTFIRFVKNSRFTSAIKNTIDDLAAKSKNFDEFLNLSNEFKNKLKYHLNEAVEEIYDEVGDAKEEVLEAIDDAIEKLDIDLDIEDILNDPKIKQTLQEKTQDVLDEIITELGENELRELQENFANGNPDEPVQLPNKLEVKHNQKQGSKNGGGSW